MLWTLNKMAKPRGAPSAVLWVLFLFLASSAKAQWVSLGVFRWGLCSWISILCFFRRSLEFFDLLPEDPKLYDKMRPPKKDGQATIVYFHVTVMGLDSIDETSMVCSSYWNFPGSFFSFLEVFQCFSNCSIQFYELDVKSFWIVSFMELQSIIFVFIRNLIHVKHFWR